ncbi:hypothetical protein QBC39DRAFT_349466 [Podospora conica]|nr:hypothetical protein QBC39DRAFT_349466 [Schizothecium conicum]
MLEGCQAGNYNNGYRVCLTSYGANVHNNKGQHQRCNTVDRSIGLCPNGWCFDKPRLQLQCQGVWHKD